MRDFKETRAVPGDYCACLDPIITVTWMSCRPKTYPLTCVWSIRIQTVGLPGVMGTMWHCRCARDPNQRLANADVLSSRQNMPICLRLIQGPLRGLLTVPARRSNRGRHAHCHVVFWITGRGGAARWILRVSPIITVTWMSCRQHHDVTSGWMYKTVVKSSKLVYASA